MPKSHPPYPPALRRQIIDLVRAGPSCGELALEYEPTANTIRNWVHQHDLDSGRRTDGLTTAEREEIRRLRREVKILREERENLKIAAAWSARDSVPPRSSDS